jgi:hypothetical protein
VGFDRHCIDSFLLPDVVDDGSAEVHHQLVNPESWLRQPPEVVEIHRFECELRIWKFFIDAVQSDNISENKIGG